MTTESYRFGIEEEYFLADSETRGTPDRPLGAFHDAAGAALPEIGRELLGRRDRRGGGGERADEDHGAREAAGELERERVGVEEKIEAVRRVGIGLGAEGEAVGDDDAARLHRRRRALAVGGGGGGHCCGGAAVWFGFSWEFGGDGAGRLGI